MCSWNLESTKFIMFELNNFSKESKKDEENLSTKEKTEIKGTWF